MPTEASRHVAIREREPGGANVAAPSACLGVVPNRFAAAPRGGGGSHPARHGRIQLPGGPRCPGWSGPGSTHGLLGRSGCRRLPVLISLLSCCSLAKLGLPGLAPAAMHVVEPPCRASPSLRLCDVQNACRMRASRTRLKTALHRMGGREKDRKRQGGRETKEETEGEARARGAGCIVSAEAEHTCCGSRPWSPRIASAACTMGANHVHVPTPENRGRRPSHVIRPWLLELW